MTVKKPDGNPPHSNQKCPLCEAAPRVAHKDDCPWQLWAEAKRTS